MIGLRKASRHHAVSLEIVPGQTLYDLAIQRTDS
jgi:hypothetical protein